MNKVVSEKLEECHKFKWDTEIVLEKLIADYRSTPHSTTGISPFEVMFKRKMSNDLRSLAPDLEGGEESEIDKKLRSKVLKKQESMKKYADDTKGVTPMYIATGDYVRVRDKDKK